MDMFLLQFLMARIIMGTDDPKQTQVRSREPGLGAKAGGAGFLRVGKDGRVASMGIGD